jgi:hypothetical protein
LTGDWSASDNIVVTISVPGEPVDISVEGTTLQLYVGVPTPVTIGGIAHTITVLSITNGSAVVEIRSTPQQVSLNIGETKEIDTDGNGKMDLSVTLNSITNGVVSLTIVPIEESTGGLPVALIAGAIVAIVIVLVLVMFMMKKKPAAKKADKPAEKNPAEKDE